MCMKDDNRSCLKKERKQTKHNVTAHVFANFIDRNQRERDESVFGAADDLELKRQILAAAVK